VKFFFKIANLIYFVFLFILGGFNYSFATDFSLSFDGTNDYVEVPFDASMNPTADFTVNAWVKTGGSSAWQSAVTSRSATTTCDEIPNLSAGYMLYIQPDEEWSFWNGNCTNNTWAQINTKVDVNLNTWQMQTITYDQSGTMMSLYVDGVLIGNNNSHELKPNGDRPLRIGAGRTNITAAYFFNGLIDEVGIWSSELSSEEIVQLYNLGETLYAGDNYGDYTSAGSLTEYWTMDDNAESNNGSGTTLFGEENNNDGTLINGPTWSTDFPGTVPTLLSSNPVDDETDTPYDTNITLTFSEIIKVGTGNITLKKTSDDSVVEIFDVTTDVSGSGTTQISINPSSDLEKGVEYYVLIDSTAIVDLSRNSYTGISSTTELSFLTGSRNSNPFDDKDILASVETQTAAPKKVVSHVTTPIFNRLNWIRGYESNENLSVQSIKFNFLNPKLAKIVNIVPVSAKNNKIPKRYNQDWLFWSEGSVSVGRVGDSANSSSKDVNTNAITLGWDKKIDDKLIHGYTITHTQDDVEVGSSGTSVNIDSYSLSTYATFHKNKNRYLESIIGVSKLDLKNIRKSGSNTLTGAREGKQIFGSLQYLNTFKKNQINISPNVKVDLSYTTLAAYSETGTSAIKYDEQQVETVGLYGGFDFNNEIIKSNYTLRPLAGLKLGLDLSPSSDVSLSYVSDPNTKHTKSIDQQDEESVKGKIGFDILTNTGWSFMTFYERNQSENSHSDSLYFLTGYVSSKEEEYAMALNDNKISLEYKKNTKGFDIKFGSNYNLMSQIPDYGATIEVLNKF
tara:strand:- start:37 stop:2406 length:2370 start_codon:yes stop_codon:yes gene_type:complete